MNQKILGVFALAMINVAAIISLRNLPMMASYGLGAIFFYCVAALTYFIPIALVSAEMATMFPRSGGSFRWVGEGLGFHWGFFAIWWAWMESIAWFPAILTFMAATIAYIFNPAWAQHKGYMLSVMLTVFWGGTFLNFKGIEFSSRLSSIGAMIGTLIPGGLIIGLAYYWIVSGHPIQLELSGSAFIPSFEIENLVFYSGVLLGLAGVEMSAFHATEAKNPQKDYPKAIFISTFIILALSIIGTLAISVVVPKEKINIVEGLMQTYQLFFESFGLKEAVPFLAFFIVLGSMAGLNTWIIGPAKGILASAEEGYIPLWLQKTNKKGVPVSTLLVQATIGTLLSSAIILMPSIESAYWIMTVLSVQFALVMYSLIFISAIVLRLKKPHLKRPYKVPGGKVGLIAICTVGFISCFFAFCIGFIPPQQLETGEIWIYEGYLLLGLFILSIPPVLCCWNRSTSV